MNNYLKIEIIKHIFNIFGISSAGNIINNSTFNDLSLYSKSITLEIEGLKVNYPVWSITYSVLTSKVNVVFCNMSSDSKAELALVFQVDSMPIYGIHLADEFSIATFACLHEGSWIVANTFLQASVLAGLEQISGFLSIGSKNDNADDLYSALVSLLESEEDS